MKNLHTHATTKYAEALKAMMILIKSDNFNQTDFQRKFELPQNFTRACVNLSFIGKCCNGKYTVALNNEIKDIHGRMISLEIVHLEKIRKMKFKIINSK